MTTKKVRSVIVPREPKKPVIEQITAIPPQWIMRGKLVALHWASNSLPSLQKLIYIYSNK